MGYLSGHHILLHFYNVFPFWQFAYIHLGLIKILNLIKIMTHLNCDSFLSRTYLSGVFW